MKTLKSIQVIRGGFMPTVKSKEEFVCTCGREFTKRFALTNHQKTCEPVPNKSNGKSNGNGKVIQVAPLTTTDRNAFKNLINERANTIMKALDDELNGKPESITNALRFSKNLLLSASQVEQLISGVDEQIQAEVESRISQEKNRIEVEIADLNESYSERETEMKERHRKEWQTLMEEKKQKISQLKQQQKTLAEEITKSECAHLLTEKVKFQKQLAYTKQEEMKLNMEVTQKIAMVTQCRGRLRHIISDAKNRALETLWTTESRVEAQSLITQIPTVSEALDLLQKKDGINELLRRINPNMQLPALPDPSQQELKAAAVEIVKENEEEDNEDEDDDDHDEIYENDDNNRRIDDNNRRRRN
jgi:hypothetical protein